MKTFCGAKAAMTGHAVIVIVGSGSGMMILG